MGEKELKLKNNVPVFYLKNNENEIYNLFYLIDLGTNEDRKLSLAIDYLDYLGTSEYSPTPFKEQI